MGLDEPQETGRRPIMGYLAGRVIRILEFILGIMGSSRKISRWLQWRKEGVGKNESEKTKWSILWSSR